MKSQSRKADKKPDTAGSKRKAPRSAFVPGDPRINRTKPGPGRPKDKFKRLCQRLTLRATRKHVRRILRDPNHQYFMQAVKWASENGFGKPDTMLEVKGKLTLEQLVSQANSKEK